MKLLRRRTKKKLVPWTFRDVNHRERVPAIKFRKASRLEPEGEIRKATKACVYISFEMKKKGDVGSNAWILLFRAREKYTLLSEVMKRGEQQERNKL